MKFSLSKFLLASLALGFGACVSTPMPSVRTWVDPKTAVSVIAQDAATVFGHDEAAGRDTLRDYAELRAIEINQTGTRHRYLVLVAWSTVGRGFEKRQQLDDALSNVKLSVNDRTVELAGALSYAQANLSAPAFAPTNSGAHEFYYEVTPEQLQILASPGTLQLVTGDEVVYRLWEDRRDDLRAWMNEIAPTS